MNNLIKKYLNQETISYLIFGVLTTAVDFAVFGLLYYMIGFGEVISNNIAWCAAVLFAFITNKLFVFRAKSTKGLVLLKEFTAFVGARIFSLIITDIFLVIARRISMNMMIAKALISILVIILNYIFSKFFIFKKNE